ncbi:hypothetical protein D9C73_005949 [Collichthys lucidus]|uniref:Uncharacterized protein n=1 Tax=Collichthys lucidus TaxID=240159 RepID=A0A4U5U8F1_COLLU|nr:hypothetical protein D9C73_005949 [Collichthys lucidus]
MDSQKEQLMIRLFTILFKVSARLERSRYLLDGRRNGKLPVPLLHHHYHNHHQHRLSPLCVPDERCLHRRSRKSDDAPCGPSLLVSPEPPLPVLHTGSPATHQIRVLCSYPGISVGFLDGKTLYWTSKKFSALHLHRVQSTSALRLRRSFLRSEGVAD